MTSRRLLLLSNSILFGQEPYEWCGDYVKSFFKKSDVSTILFIPYAIRDYDGYVKKIKPSFEKLADSKYVTVFHELKRDVESNCKNLRQSYEECLKFYNVHLYIFATSPRRPDGNVITHFQESKKSLIKNVREDIHKSEKQFEDLLELAEKKMLYNLQRYLSSIDIEVVFPEESFILKSCGIPEATHNSGCIQKIEAVKLNKPALNPEEFRQFPDLVEKLDCFLDQIGEDFLSLTRITEKQRKRLFADDNVRDFHSAGERFLAEIKEITTNTKNSWIKNLKEMHNYFLEKVEKTLDECKLSLKKPLSELMPDSAENPAKRTKVTEGKRDSFFSGLVYSLTDVFGSHSTRKSLISSSEDEIPSQSFDANNSIIPDEETSIQCGLKEPADNNFDVASQSSAVEKDSCELRSLSVQILTKMDENFSPWIFLKAPLSVSSDPAVFEIKVDSEASPAYINACVDIKEVIDQIKENSYGKPYLSDFVRRNIDSLCIRYKKFPTIAEAEEYLQLKLASYVPPFNA